MGHRQWTKERVRLSLAQWTRVYRVTQRGMRDSKATASLGKSSSGNSHTTQFHAEGPGSWGLKRSQEVWQGLGRGSVEKHLLSMCKVRGSIPPIPRCCREMGLAFEEWAQERCRQGCRWHDLFVLLVCCLPLCVLKGLAIVPGVLNGCVHNKKLLVSLCHF